jgi:hypothetical protein
MGRNQPPSKFYVLKYSVMWNSAKWIMLPVFHHSMRELVRDLLKVRVDWLSGLVQIVFGFGVQFKFGLL